jgi:hypothetical protein
MPAQSCPTCNATRATSGIDIIGERQQALAPDSGGDGRRLNLTVITSLRQTDQEKPSPRPPAATFPDWTPIGRDGCR